MSGHQDRHTRNLQTHLVKSHQERREREGQLVGEVSFIEPVSDITQYRQRKRLTVQERQDMRQYLREDGKEKILGGAGCLG